MAARPDVYCRHGQEERFMSWGGYLRSAKKAIPYRDLKSMNSILARPVIAGSISRITEYIDGFLSRNAVAVSKNVLLHSHNEQTDKIKSFRAAEANEARHHDWRHSST